MDKIINGFSANDVSASAAVFAALVAFIALVIVIVRQLPQQTRTLKLLSNQFELQALSNNVQALNVFIMEHYVRRNFTLLTTIEIKDKQYDFVNSRLVARRLFLDNPEQWKRDCSAKNFHDWQYLVANEISHSLQDMGIAVLIGIIPLRLLLAMLGDSLILDWLIIKEFVESYRRKDGLYSRKIWGISNYKLYAKRRHAEWLALITYLWLVDNWAYDGSDHTILTEMLNSYKNKEAVKDRINDISKADHVLMTPAVRREVKDLIGLDI